MKSDFLALSLSPFFLAAVIVATAALSFNIGNTPSSKFTLACFLASILPILLYIFQWHYGTKKMLTEFKTINNKFSPLILLIRQKNANWIPENVIKVLSSFQDKNIESCGGAEVILPLFVKILLVMKASLHNPSTLKYHHDNEVHTHVLREAVASAQVLWSKQKLKETIFFEDFLCDYAKLTCFEDNGAKKVYFVVEEIPSMKVYYDYFTQLNNLVEAEGDETLLSLNLLNKAVENFKSFFFHFQDDTSGAYKEHQTIFVGHGIGGSIIEACLAAPSLTPDFAFSFGSLPGLFKARDSERELDVHEKYLSFVNEADIFCFLTPSFIGSLESGIKKLPFSSDAILEEVTSNTKGDLIQQVLTYELLENQIVDITPVSRATRVTLVSETTSNSKHLALRHDCLKQHSFVNYKHYLSRLLKMRTQRVS